MIIANHNAVDAFDNIPQQYIDEVKKMWLSYAGESHASAIRRGMELLETSDATYAVNITESGTPEAATTNHLRVSSAMWGDHDNSSGWQYLYGEEDWWTNSTAISRTKASLSYCHNNGPALTAVGFGWCWDATWINGLGGTQDPVYYTRWAGSSVDGPDGNLRWGLDSGIDTYINATQEYIDYCATNGIATKIIWTTGPIDNDSSMNTGEIGYQQYLKYQRIRNHVNSLSSGYFFDFADILSYNDSNQLATTTWTDGNSVLQTFPLMHADNYVTWDNSYHFGSIGAIRLAKAMWWLLARMAGWNGN
jgi:hypothetical protein